MVSVVDGGLPGDSNARPCLVIKQSSHICTSRHNHYSETGDTQPPLVRISRNECKTIHNKGINKEWLEDVLELGASQLFTNSYSVTEICMSLGCKATLQVSGQPGSAKLFVLQKSDLPEGLLLGQELLPLLVDLSLYLELNLAQLAQIIRNVTRKTYNKPTFSSSRRSCSSLRRTL